MSKNDLYIYASLVITLNIVTTIYNHNYQQMIAEIGIKVRTSVTALVYRKALRLGTTAISDITMGKIVTLITRDVFSFENALIFVNDMWISIFQIGLISYLIFQRIGWSVVAGIGFYLATIPLQSKLEHYNLFTNKGVSIRAQDLNYVLIRSCCQMILHDKMIVHK